MTNDNFEEEIYEYDEEDAILDDDLDLNSEDNNFGEDLSVYDDIED